MTQYSVTDSGKVLSTHPTLAEASEAARLASLRHPNAFAKVWSGVIDGTGRGTTAHISYHNGRPW